MRRHDDEDRRHAMSARRRRFLVRCLTLLLALLPAAGARAQGEGPAPLRAPLGVTYTAWRGGFADAPARLAMWKELGFPLVTLVPAYAYVGLDRIERGSGPDAEELGGAIEAA